MNLWKYAGVNWDTFWFSIGKATHLGLVRIVFFSVVSALFLRDNLALSISSFDPSFWHPIAIIDIFFRRPPDYPVLRALEVALDLALVGSIAGFLTRTMTAIAAGLGLYFIGMLNSFGTISHGRTPVALCLIVMATSACGDAFSVDTWIRRRWRGAATDDPTGGRYHWPIQLMRVLWCLVFFSAGLSKIQRSGLEWAFSNNLATMLLVAPHRYPESAIASVVHGLGAWLAGIPRLCVMLAFATLCLELAAPLALVGRRSALGVVTLISVAQVFIYLTMFENFVWFLPTYVAWLPTTRAFTPSNRDIEML